MNDAICFKEALLNGLLFDQCDWDPRSVYEYLSLLPLDQVAGPIGKHFVPSITKSFISIS